MTVANVRLTPEEISEQCTQEAKKSKATMAKIVKAEDPIDEIVWNRKYKFFSNPVMKYSHGNYIKAMNDPLRGPITPWEDNFVLPEHRWVEGKSAGEVKSSSSGEPRPPLGLPGAPTVPQKAGPPTLQPTASDEALAKTLEKVNKMVGKSPRSLQTSQRVWSKYHYFAGGGLNSGRFKLHGKDDPWAWALDTRMKHEKHQLAQDQQRAPSTSKQNGRPF